MRKSALCHSLIIAVAIILVLAATFSSEAQDKRGVRVTGAGLLSEVVESNAEQFSKTNPSCQFVVTGATTGIGFQQMVEGGAEIAMMTRKVTPEEAKVAEAKGVPLAYKYIGKVGLAVITNAKNTVNELTMDQLARIFKGDIENWSQVGGPNEPMRVTIRAVPETGAGVLFQTLVLGNAPYAKSAQVMSSYATTAQVCGRSFAIGYIPTTTVHFEKLSERGAKILRIKKDEHSQPYQLGYGVARESLYPISVEFNLYWNSRQQNSCIKDFAEFCEKQAE
jgi:phosphate transport system substrate-binding protein